MEEALSKPTPGARSGRFLRRRTILLPTWRLSLIVAVVIGVPAVLAFLNLYRWLAVTEPITGAPVLIVEGWIPDHALEAAASRAEAAEMPTVFCTGIPMERGSFDLPYDSYADYAAATLVKMGAPADRMHSIPCEVAKTERTRAMARALAAHWKNEPAPTLKKQANLFTSAAHARRSRQIYRQELGPEWEIGVISHPDPEVNPSRWFLGSKSAKEAITEVVALTVGLFGAN